MGNSSRSLQGKKAKSISGCGFAGESHKLCRCIKPLLRVPHHNAPQYTTHPPVFSPSLLLLRSREIGKLPFFIFVSFFLALSHAHTPPPREFSLAWCCCIVVSLFPYLISGLRVRARRMGREAMSVGGHRASGKGMGVQEYQGSSARLDKTERS